MQKLIVVLLLLLLSIHLASAQGVSVSYQISPALLLPGDYAECTLTISAPATGDVVVNSVTLTGYGVDVTPQILSVGKIPAGGSVSVPFSIKAKKVGRYSVVASISTQNDTIRQNIQVVVDDSFPSITLTSSVREGEVNTLSFYVSSPVELKAVRVEALFNATPRSVYLGNVGSEGAEGVLKFIPSSSTLKFRISFYNGNNYHEVVRVIEARMLKSNGIAINATLPYKTIYLGDVVDLPVEVANLRGDNILNVRVTVEGFGFSDSAEIPKIAGGENGRVTFKFSPSESGEGNITITVRYSDEFGNTYTQAKKLSADVLESLPVSITSLNVVTEGTETRVSGDISNNGRSVVYNVYTSAICGEYQTDYFVGNIDPSDFQSFDLPIKCNKSATVTVSWSNDVGERFEIHREIKVGEELLPPPETSEYPILVSVIAVVVVLAIVGAILYRYIRK